MKLKPVNEIPKSKTRGNLRLLIEEFADLDDKIAEFVWQSGEYVDSKSARGLNYSRD